MSDFHLGAQPEDLQNLGAIMQSFDEEFRCGLVMKSLQYLKLDEIYQKSIVPKQWVEAELSIALNADGNVITYMDYFEKIPNFIPVVLTFYNVLKSTNAVGVEPSQPGVYSTLSKLNVISLKVVNAESRTFIEDFFTRYGHIINNWTNLKNSYTQVAWMKGMMDT